MRLMKNISVVAIFGFLSVCFPLYAFSQIPSSSEALKFRLAKSFEQSGDYENALRLYAELYKLRPESIVYFDGLEKMYVQLKRYDDAIALLSDRLKLSPADVNLIATLGDVYYKAGREKDALREWDRAISVDPKSTNIYRTVAAHLMENRLFDKAADVYLRARREIGDKTLFASDLGYLYMLLLRFGDATREYISLLLRDPNQLGYIESRIAGYTDRADGLQAAISVAKEEIQRHHENILPLQYLLAWLYLEGKQYTDAFDVYRTIDQMTSRDGTGIFSFAERAFHEKAFEPARRAYKLLLEEYPKSSMRPQALLGYARTLEALSSVEDTTESATGTRWGVQESNANAMEALRYYQKLVTDYPSTEYAAQGLYQIASILFRHSFDLNRSVAAISELEQTMPWSHVIPRAKLLHAEVLTVQANTAAARGKFSEVLSSKEASPYEHDQAAFGLAQLAYFEGQFDEARKQLQPLAENLTSDFSNDALKLLSFIEENQGANPEPLRLYAKAQLLERERRLSEAVEALKELLRQFESSTLTDEAVLGLARLYAQMGEFQNAVATYDSVLQKFPDSIYRDEAAYQRAQILDLKLHDRAGALKAYEAFLAQFPDSLHVSEVRKRIRELRGDFL
ncbi:MAG: tetratricopeptide repeat protein [Bacteroidota bacterium]